MAIALSNADRHPHRATGGIGLSVHQPKFSVKPPMSPSQGAPPWTRQEAREMVAPVHGIGHFAAGGMMSASEGSPWWERSSQRIMDAPFHSGLIPGDGAGRTDRLPLSVGSGSHVIPADVVSGVGQGTTGAGANILGAAIRSGPFGVAPPAAVHGHGPPAAPHPVPIGGIGLAEGGQIHKPTSILAASGEFVVEPEAVRAIGERGIAQGMGKRGESADDVGHRLLDEMIARVRKHIIQWTKTAPPPKR